MRIGAVLSGAELRLLNHLADANAAQALNSLRLATGKNINRPADDPSGFAALSRFQSDAGLVAHALNNVTAASSIVSQSQLALDQIRTQLNTIRTKAVADQDQALSADQRTANQAAIDAAITEINRLAATEVGGRRILDGSANFSASGVNTSQIKSLDVVSRGFTTSPTISGTVTVAAERAELVHTEGTGLITNNATFALSGDRGQAVISVTTGETLATVATRVNQESHLTGVTASVAGNDLRLTSIEYGSRADVAVAVSSGTFAVTGGGGDGAAEGVDGAATINGRSVTGAGNKFTLNDNGFSFTLETVGGFSGALSTVTVTGDALTFALTTDSRKTSTLAIPGVQAARLGGLSGTLDQLFTAGSAAGLGTNAPLAVRIIDEALGDLTLIEGRVDGFADATIASSAALLTGMDETLQDSIDAIDEVNEDAEETLQAKNEQLAANALAGLAILDRQRLSILVLIQKIAGLI